jgi:uncharacterized protein
MTLLPRTRVRRPTPRSLLAGLAVLALLALTAVGIGRVRIDTGIGSFLPEGDPVYSALEDKAETFGSDPVIVLLEGQQDHELLTRTQHLLRLMALEGDLAALDDVAAVYGPGTVLNQTAGATQDMLAQISGRRDGLRQQAEAAAEQAGLSAARVRAAGDAAVRAFDRRYGSLVVQALPAGLPTLRNPSFVQTVMFEPDGDPRAQWRFVVPDADTVAILVRPDAHLTQAETARLSDAVRKTVAESGLPVAHSTVTGAPVLTAALAERANHELPVLGAVSVAAVGLVFLLVPWTARRRSRLRPTIAALLGTVATLAVFGWSGQALSLGVVAFLPILLGIGSDFPLYLSRGGRDRRVLVAAGAAAVGFASLAVSPLPFVRELGVALAVGIAATAAVALLMRRLLGPVPGGPASGLVAQKAKVRLGRDTAAVVAVLAVGVSGTGWALLPVLDIQAQPEELAQGLPELTDVEYAEEELGSSGEVSVMLTGRDIAAPQVLRWSQTVQARIVRDVGDQVHPVLSLADLFRFLGDNPTQAQVNAAMSLVPDYLTSAVVSPDRTQGLLVLGVEFDDVEELHGLLARIESATRAAPPGTDVEVVGLPVAAARGLDLISEGRIWMNVTAIGAAGLVLLVGLRSRRDAARAVLTVLLATGWVGAIAWATLGSLNPLTIAIGSLTTATGCEFAVLLSRSGRAGRPLREVGTAALAGTTGYLVLALSQLAILRDFGLLLGAGVACSFAAALLVDRVLVPDRPPVVSEPAVSPAPVGQAGEREEVLL